MTVIEDYSICQFEILLLGDQALEFANLSFPSSPSELRVKAAFLQLVESSHRLHR